LPPCFFIIADSLNSIVSIDLQKMSTFTQRIYNVIRLNPKSTDASIYKINLQYLDQSTLKQVGKNVTFQIRIIPPADIS